MRDFSDGFTETVNDQHSKSVVLTMVVVELEHTLNGTLEKYEGYYVNDYLPVESVWKGNVVTFQPAAFKISLGSDTNDSVPKTKIDFDAGDRQFIRLIRASEGNPKVYMQVALSSSPQRLEIGPVEFQVEAFAIKSTSVSADLTVEPILNEPVPATRYTPQSFSQLWRGSRD